MAVLLQMLPREEQLLVGLHQLRRHSCLGTVGNGAHLIALGVPAQYGTLTINEQFHRLKSQLIELGAFHIYRFREHRLG